VTKTVFSKRVHSSLEDYPHLKALRASEVEQIVDVLFAELRELIREGDELTISGLGKFYPKHMRPRKVWPGLEKDGRPPYTIPAKIKLGFSSYNACDRYVSTPLPSRRRGFSIEALERMLS